MSLCELSAYELNQKINRLEVSVEEVVEESLKRCHSEGLKFNAFVTVCDENARIHAKIIDEKINRGEEISQLMGIPIAVKDNICIKNIPCTCASRILSNYIPPYDASVVENLLSNGCVIIGKTNMDEFAMGSSNENSFFGNVINPWSNKTVPGGSSGGSAAAVAAGIVPIALGSDTGGSIRQPASFCGIVGLKPTYGRVSRYGLVAFASSLDQIGPIARDVFDCALLLKLISGWDVRDSTSSRTSVSDYTALLNRNLNLRRIKIGVPKEFFEEGVEEEVKYKVLDAIEVIRDMGCEVKEVSLPNTKYGIACYYLLATAEASSNLARYDGIKYGYRASNFEKLLNMYENTRNEGFGKEVKRRILLGTYVLSAGYYDAYYRKASEVREYIKMDYQKVFQEVDCLITPTSPTVAFNIGEKIKDPLQMYMSDVLTVSANLAGIPAISLPCGLSSDGLPVGLQIMGRDFEEDTILCLAYAFEKKSGISFKNLKNNLKSQRRDG